ncbi:MAG: DUF3501 family protein [Geothrix sp.]|uniref:DUF3501 family protein n=1 Tax=Geothrix sp. TaxID=1962974 RepID=UPI00181FC021|nr:DUF3501 family protein [Geothrix sp.]NWJ41599.1 DUF3501 family protein [Geothrix sp.]WIL20419.1 MAG: DUF3501 family protein [Geothrix sp.]
MNLVFDPATELARYETRQALLGRQAALRLELAEGITFQPETAESVEDQVVETLWAEGLTLETAPAEDVVEARASFAVLAPRREHGGRSVVATLFLGFPDAVRDAKLAALQRFPDQLRLELSDGSLAAPAVDRGAAGPEDRLPAVLALRFFLPDGCRIAALVSNHAVVPGRWSAPPTWDAWPS